MSNYTAPEVETAQLREAFERCGMSKSEVARRLGWMIPHVDRLNRALGYRPDSNSRAPGVRPVPRQRVSYRLALEIAEAMGVDPVDVGL